MSKIYKLIIVLIIASLLVLIIYPLGILPIKNLVTKIIYPLSNGLTGISDTFTNFFDKIKNIKNLTAANQNLRDENTDLKAQLDVLNELKHENDILREELGFIKNQGDKKLIPAQIVGRSSTGFLQTLKLNKGRVDGVKNNQPVISHGYLIGTISQSGENFSEVFLITNSNSLIPVVLQQSRGTGLLKGGLGGLIVDEIPLDSSIVAGEEVLTSGLGGDLPSAIPVGKVEKITSRESEIFQEVSIISPINFNRLEVIFVLDN